MSYHDRGTKNAVGTKIMMWMKKLALSALIGASSIAVLPAEAEARDQQEEEGEKGGTLGHGTIL